MSIIYKQVIFTDLYITKCDDCKSDATMNEYQEIKKRDFKFKKIYALIAFCKCFNKVYISGYGEEEPPKGFVKVKEPSL